MAPASKERLVPAKSYRYKGIDLIPDYKTPGIFHGPGGRVYTEPTLLMSAAEEIIIHIERRPYMPE